MTNSADSDQMAQKPTDLYLHSKGRAYLGSAELGLTLSALQTKTNTFANSIGTDETTLWQAFAILIFVFCSTPICNCGHVQNQSWKRPVQKPLGVMVNKHAYVNSEV